VQDGWLGGVGEPVQPHGILAETLQCGGKWEWQ